MNTKCKLIIATALLAAAPFGNADMNDDPALFKVLFDAVEWQPDEENLNWDAHAWYGRDLQKLWLKTEGERSDEGTESASAQLLYGMAVAPYWDFQVGARHEYTPAKDKNWFAVGLHGLAPYFFETEVNAFIDADGMVGISLETEREILLTQKLVLAPEIEVVGYSTDEPEMRRGSGLSSVEAGLRLRYEIRREVAPYIGVVWERAYGETADIKEMEGDSVEETEWVVGVRAWF